jgi:hypothetical protein
VKRREFMTLVGGGLRSRTLIPKEMKIEHFLTVKDLTDDELKAVLAVKPDLREKRRRGHPA